MINVQPLFNVTANSESNNTHREREATLFNNERAEGTEFHIDDIKD